MWERVTIVAKKWCGVGKLAQPLAWKGALPQGVEELRERRSEVPRGSLLGEREGARHTARREKGGDKSALGMGTLD